MVALKVPSSLSPAAKLHAAQLAAASQAALQASALALAASAQVRGACEELTRAVSGWLASGSDSSSDTSIAAAVGLCAVSVNATAGVIEPLVSHGRSSPWA